MYLGNREKAYTDLAYGKIIVDGGEIAGRTGINSYYGDITLANYKNSRGDLIIKNGGKAYFNNLHMARGDATSGVGRTALLELSGKGSSLRLSNLHAGLDITPNGNSADIYINSGAQISVDSAFNFYSTSSLNLNLDSSGIQNTGTAVMFKGNRGGFSSGVEITIDGSLLGDSSDLTKDSAITVDLLQFTIGQTINIAGENLIVNTANESSILAALKGIISIENNTDLDFWNNFSKDDLSFENGTLSLALHFIPEPSTYAAILGALALALAAYRRRK